MNDLMSGGMHRLWKDRFVRRVKPRAGEAILDMAGGTGDIAFRMAESGALVTVADINPDMLDVGMERAEQARHRRPRLAERECRDAELRRRELRCLHHRLRHPERHRYPRRAARSAPRAQARRALLLPRILDQRMARLRRALRRAIREGHPAGSARRSPTTRTAIATSSNRSGASRAMDAFRTMIARRRVRRASGRADPRRAGRDPGGWKI